MLKIEKDVVIPNQRRKNSFSQKARRAAAEMSGSDSVVVKTIYERDALVRAIKNLYGPKSTITRKELTGYRVWRYTEERDRIVAVA